MHKLATSIEARIVFFGNFVFAMNSLANGRSRAGPSTLFHHIIIYPYIECLWYQVDCGRVLFPSFPGELE